MKWGTFEVSRLCHSCILEEVFCLELILEEVHFFSEWSVSPIRTWSERLDIKSVISKEDLRTVHCDEVISVCGIFVLDENESRVLTRKLLDE